MKQKLKLGYSWVPENQKNELCTNCESFGINKLAVIRKKYEQMTLLGMYNSEDPSHYLCHSCYLNKIMTKI